MLRATVVDSAYTANTNIPLKASMITNGNVGLNTVNNTIVFKKAGYYNVKANIVFTLTADDVVSLRLLGNGTPIPGAIFSENVAAGEGVTLIINDVIKVTNTNINEYANISLQIDAAGNVDDGAVIIERVN